MVAQNGKLLFMRESHDSLWSLPGGWADIGESRIAKSRSARCRRKPARSQSQQIARGVRQGAPRYPSTQFWYCYKLFVRCELRGVAPPARGLETLDTGFFGANEIPPLSTPRVTEAQVRRMFEHLANPELRHRFRLKAGCGRLPRLPRPAIEFDSNSISPLTTAWGAMPQAR